MTKSAKVNSSDDCKMMNILAKATLEDNLLSKEKLGSINEQVLMKCSAHCPAQAQKKDQSLFKISYILIGETVSIYIV